MALQFPGEELPRKADNFNAPGYDFTMHDLFHLIVGSCIPRKLRQELLKNSEGFLNIKKEGNIQSHPVTKLMLAINDLESQSHFYSYFNTEEVEMLPITAEDYCFTLLLGLIRQVEKEIEQGDGYQDRCKKKVQPLVEAFNEVVYDGGLDTTFIYDPPEE